MAHRPLFPFVLSLALAACSPQTPPDQAQTPPAPGTAAAPTEPDIPTKQGQTTSYRYQCGELDVTAHFHGEGDADIGFNGRILTLPHVSAAEGARYADAAGNAFHSSAAGEANLIVAGEAPRVCRGPGALPTG